MTHRLEPLLNPRSVVVVGASARPHSMGFNTLANILAGNYQGDLYAINPGYESVQGLPCHTGFDSLPETPELAIFCVGDTRIEAAVEEAIAAGVRAVSIMSTLFIDNDNAPGLRHRVASRIRGAGLVACGANGMGFYNVDSSLWACGFAGRRHDAPGAIAMISHSGSGMCGIADCDERLRFNLAVSTGNELDATMDEYIDYALDLPTTRVIGLFVETARNPAAFRAALKKANQKRIPVVAIKVGRTQKSAELAVSHSGAIAGDDAAYEALFDRYGVQRVSDMDELATALILFSEWDVPGDGGLVVLHDSGGERQLMIDLADAHGVELAQLAPDTIAELEKRLDPELPAVNPLDGWSRGGPDHDQNMTDCLALMMQGPSASVGLLMHDRAPGGGIYENYADYMIQAYTQSGKPVALVSARQGTGSDPRVVELTHRGFPVLDGVSNFLIALRAVFGWRDFLGHSDDLAAVPDAAVADKCRNYMRSGEPVGEYEALRMLSDFGISVAAAERCDDAKSVLESASRLGYPVALKTAAPGLAHKSDLGGVALDLNSDVELSKAYRQMCAHLGPQVLVAGMVPAGVEMILGARRDPQLGPVIIFGFGGIYSELLGDAVFALPPFGPGTARRLLAKLRMSPLLDGARGRGAVDIGALCELAARFSTMVHVLRDDIEEIDINPVVVGPDSATAVDALLIPRTLKGQKS